MSPDASRLRTSFDAAVGKLSFILRYCNPSLFGSLLVSLFFMGFGGPVIRRTLSATVRT